MFSLAQDQQAGSLHMPGFLSPLLLLLGLARSSRGVGPEWPKEGT